MYSWGVTEGALHVAFAFRTVSEHAVLVVASVVLIDLLAKAKRIVYQEKHSLGKQEAARITRANTMKA